MTEPKHDRRSFIKTGLIAAGAGLAATSLPRTLSAKGSAEGAGDAKASEEEKIVDLLFVQTAKSMELRDGRLRLQAVNPVTIYFSDRPERLVGHEPTESFVASWGDGDNSFAENPPNAALSILGGSEPQEVIRVLDKPRLEGSDLVYDVRVLEGASILAGSMVSLFIDPVGMPASPTSVAGRHRRRRRRVVRRN